MSHVFVYFIYFFPFSFTDKMTNDFYYISLCLINEISLSKWHFFSSLIWIWLIKISLFTILYENRHSSYGTRWEFFDFYEWKNCCWFNPWINPNSTESHKNSPQFFLFCSQRDEDKLDVTTSFSRIIIFFVVFILISSTKNSAEKTTKIIYLFFLINLTETPFFILFSLLINFSHLIPFNQIIFLGEGVREREIKFLEWVSEHYSDIKKFESEKYFYYFFLFFLLAGSKHTNVYLKAENHQYWIAWIYFFFHSTQILFSFSHYAVLRLGRFSQNVSLFFRKKKYNKLLFEV